MKKLFVLAVGFVLTSTFLYAGGLTGKKIAIDAGHGGSDPGAVGPTGLQEKAITLRVAKKVDSYLKSQGATTMLTRDSDVYISPSGRGTLANNWGAHTFVSVHFNAVTDRSVNGTEVLYHPTRNASNKTLAGKLQNRLIKSLGLRNRGIKERTNLGLLNIATMPTALTEPSFISNTYEEARLKDAGYIDKIGRAHYLGILDYYGVAENTPPPPPSPTKPLSGKKIAVDPQGGGSTSAGIGPTGLKGKEVNLKVATVVRNCLVVYGGANVVMTRDADVSMTTANRVTFINNSGADKMISIAFARSSNPSRNFTRTFYYKSGANAAGSLKLANGIQKRLVEALKLTDKGVGSSSAAILKGTANTIGVLTRPSHLSNPYEEARLKDIGYTWKIGKAIYEGIVDSYR